MAEKLGFYELLEPYFFGLVTQNASATTLRDLRDASAQLNQSFPGAASTLSHLATTILDYLSIEELLCTADESAVVYRGSARFGGEGRANPDLPPSQSLTSAGGQELSWQDDMLSFRLTVPRRGGSVAIDTTGLSGGDLTDVQQLNALLGTFADTPAGTVSDVPGSDFRLELLIRTVRLVLPKKDFLPARVGADGWLEPDPNFEQVVFDFPRLAFVLEQQGSSGNLNLTLRSWDSAGFDDPGDVDTARLFTMTPPLFLHSSRYVGFGIERIVADFSDDVTPPEILEQFGIGDDFNGLWLPLVRIFIAPGRTTGFAFSARGQDLLFDLDHGFSGEVALDILRRGGQLEVEPVFYRENAKTPLELQRGQITRHPDGTTEVAEGSVTIPGDGEMHLSIRGSISPYQVGVQFNGAPLSPDTSAGVNLPKWLIPAAEDGVLTIDVSDNGHHNSWHETIEVCHVAPPGPLPPPQRCYQVLLIPGAGDDPAFTITKVDNGPCELEAVLRLSPDFPVPVLQVILPQPQTLPRHADGTYHPVLTPGDAPAPLVATWHTPPPLAPTGDLAVPDQIDLVKEPDRGARLFFEMQYPLRPARDPAAIVANILSNTQPFFGHMGPDPDDFRDHRAAILSTMSAFLAATEGDIVVSGFASYEKASNFPNDQSLSDARAQTLKLLLEQVLAQNPPATSRSVGVARGYAHDAAEADAEQDSDPRFRVAIATAAPLSPPHTRAATIQLVDVTPPPAPDPPMEHPPEAAEPERPPIFRRISFRARFERNEPVLGEVSGELDFRTEAEEAAGFIQTSDNRNTGTSDVANAVQSSPAASKSGDQGVLDYRLTISYDTATRRLTEVLALGFDQQASDGWVHIDPFNPTRLADTLGSLMVFAPLLNASIDSAVDAQGSEATKDIIVAASEAVLATTLGLTGMLKFRKLTLFGIELSATELLPDDQSQESTQFGNLSALFDYAVDFEVDVNLLVLTVRSK